MSRNARHPPLSTSTKYLEYRLYLPLPTLSHTPDMRRIASQVPDSVGRLIQSGHIKSPPTWYAAVLANPPPQITARRQKIQKRLDPKGQVSDELPRLFKVKGAMRAPKLRIQQIRYREDEIRRKFYQDFPFEAMRPATLVEMREIQEEHAIRGEAWTALAQRGAYPTVEE
jgi:small subunit ribosomal protein S23